MKPLVVIFLICPFLLMCPSVHAGETLVPLKAGKSGALSCGLSCLVGDSNTAANRPIGSDLVLVLRNVGAKWMGLDRLTVDDFKLQDAHGHEIKVYPLPPPQGIGYGDAEIIRLDIAKAGDAPSPWTLKLKKTETFLSIDLTIVDIQLPKK